MHAVSLDLTGEEVFIEYRREARRYFVVFPNKGLELSMAPRQYEVAYYLAYSVVIGEPFHRGIPCFPRNTPWPRPNIKYPKEVPMEIKLVETEGNEVAIPQQKEEAAMATTVTVKARAWGALVTITKKSEGTEGHNVETQEHEIPGNTIRDFTIVEGEKISVEMGAAPPVGGREDTLGDFAKFDHDGDGHPGGSKKKKPDETS